MAYTVKIYSSDFSTNLTTLFYGQDIYDFKYKNEINKPGGASFSINTRNTKATTSNLKMFNKVIINKGDTGVFIGYIENIRATIDVIEITCIGMLGFFKKRLFEGAFHSGQAPVPTGATAFFDILDTANALYDTGITEGTSDITYAINNLQYVRSDILSAWQKLANLAEGEFQIKTDKSIDFLERLGEDKSDTINLKYKVTQIDSSNLRNFDVEVQGKDMTNRVIGVRDGGTTSTKQDATSISDFGMIEETVNFAQTNSDADLGVEAQSYLDTRKIEFYAPQLVVNEEKVDTDNLNLGDTVLVSLDNGFISLERNERIIQKEVIVSDNLTEQVSLKLMPETGNLLPSSFLSGIVTLSKRVSLLEGTV